MGRRQRLEDRRQGLRHRRMVRRTGIRGDLQMLRDELRDSERAAGPAPRALSRSRGLSWIQRIDARSLSDHDLEAYVRQSYRYPCGRLPKSTQQRLGFSAFDNEAPAVTPSEIRSAHARIREHIRRTPILETASPIAGAPPLSLKLECLQATGSFKARGAFHNLLTRPASAASCATASGGNHGAAVAYAAQKLASERGSSSGNRLSRQDREDQGLWGRGRHWRGGVCRGPGTLRRLCRGKRRVAGSILTMRSKRSPAKERWDWNGRRTSTIRAQEARHGPSRGGRGRAYCWHGRLV